MDAFGVDREDVAKGLSPNQIRGLTRVAGESNERLVPVRGGRRVMTFPQSDEQLFAQRRLKAHKEGRLVGRRKGYKATGQGEKQMADDYLRRAREGAEWRHAHDGGKLP